MKKLAITIPCRNTHYLLKDNIPKIMNSLKNFEEVVSVYIFDNSDNDFLKKQIENLNYKNLFYYKNELILDPDTNFLQCYSVPKEEYVWLLGDAFYFSKESIKILLNKLNNFSYDYLVINAGREIRYPTMTKEYADSKLFFNELAWHATLAGATILKKELINYIIDTKKYEKYLYSNFIQLGFLLEGNLKYNKGVYLQESIINFNKNKKKSSWNNKSFEVFGTGWIKFINSLPNEYDDNFKKNVIKMHGIESRYFKALNLLKLRSDENISLEDYYKYKDIFPLITDENIYLFKLICSFPKDFTKIIYKIFLNLDRIKRVLKNPKLLKKL